jgi:hypothetical protein
VALEGSEDSCSNKEEGGLQRGREGAGILIHRREEREVGRKSSKFSHARHCYQQRHTVK